MATVSRAGDAVPVNAANRFAHIDALRAFAVMMVVVMHSGLTFIPGDAGVTVFFCISGVVITLVLLRERDRSGTFSARSFYRRRFFKLAPPFVLAVLGPTLVYMIHHHVDWGAFLSQIFFSYNWVLATEPVRSAQILPGSDVVWSLAVEEQFYIVFALAWMVIVRSRRWRRNLVALAALAIIYSVTLRCWLSTDTANTDYLLRGTDARMEAIGWGILIAVVYHSGLDGSAGWVGRLRADIVPAAAIVFFVSAEAFRTPWTKTAIRPSIYALAAAVIILYGLIPGESAVKRLFYRLCTVRLVQIVGLASYSIYIVHHVAASFLEGALMGLPLAVRSPLLILIGVAAGVGMYFLVEVPALRVRRKLDRRRGTEAKPLTRVVTTEA